MSDRNGQSRVAAPAVVQANARASVQASTLATFLVAAALLAGCTVGPDFVPPSAPGVTAYVQPDQAPRLVPGPGEPPQRLAPAGDIPGQWWQLFHSPQLDPVVRAALAGNPGLEAARARLAQARAAVAVARGGEYPQVDFGAQAARQRGPAFALGLLPAGAGGLPEFNLFALGPEVGYAPDVFGLTARGVEQQRALAEDACHELTAAQLALTGNVVAQAVAIATDRRQLDALRRILVLDERNLALVRDRQEAGRIGRDGVLAAEARLAADRALLPPLQQQLAAAEDALAVLVGQSPAQWRTPAFELADFTLPAELPVSLPSALVRQRPDILAAQARLHAASAAIGVATARMYPQFPLSASLDTAGLATTSLFTQSSLVWTLAGGLSAPVFHGGALRAQRRAAEAEFQAALAAYRQTVLQAFGQVADTLRALGHDAELAAAERRALQAARGRLELQRLRAAAGRSDALQVLEAERAVEQNRLGHVQARAARYLDSARLLVALGGGWWNASNPCAPPPRNATGPQGDPK